MQIMFEGGVYRANLVNMKFDDKKYKRKEIYQIRYNKTSELAVVLRSLFSDTYEYLVRKRLQRVEGDRSLIKIPDNKKEYLILYTTEYTNILFAEVITAIDLKLGYQAVKELGDEVFERMVNYTTKDKEANIILDKRTVKIRKLNRAISEELKLLYDYRCQICGEYTGKEYGANVVESHHIDYYASSLNNDAQNQLIVCPNHHSIIHQVKPIFDYRNKTFTYKNGISEKLRINYHII